MGEHCRAPGCGRFVAKGTRRCEHHAAGLPGDEGGDHDGLDREIHALREVMEDLLKVKDVEVRARLVPRVASATVQAVRARHQLEGDRLGDILDGLGTLLEQADEAERPSADAEGPAGILAGP